MSGRNITQKKIHNGFSLLEVMVALALLALSFTSLVLVQARATKLAIEGRNISIATELARLQLMECKREAQKKISSVSDLKLEGDFEEQGFANFKWECHAPKFNMKTPSTSQMEKSVKSNTPEKAKKDVGASASVSAPFITMITDALGDSVRELVVIVRFSDNNIEEEVRVVTHVVDLAAMSGLSRMLSQGAKTFEKSLPGKKTEEQQPPMPQGPPGMMPQGPPPGTMPPGHPPMPPPMRPRGRP